MISDARGGHVSPGVYTEEKDVVYSAKSLGITSLGLVGETLKGPAFQPIAIEDWSDFVDYFGGTSPEKYKGSKYPKYELPYIAKSYLSESRNLHVCRVLGLSGYDAGSAFVITFTYDGKTYPAVVLRSKGKYGEVKDAENCNGSTSEGFAFEVKDVDVVKYEYDNYAGGCEGKISGSGSIEISGDANTEVSKKFGLKVTTESGEFTVNVSLNPADRDYIYKVFGTDPLYGAMPLFVEAVYDKAIDFLVGNDPVNNPVKAWAWGKSKVEINDYKSCFRAAMTPWIVSEIKGINKEEVLLKKLFRVYTISDGNASNYQVKISIQNIKPEENTFDLLVRDFYDTDANPVVLEKFSRCSMEEGTSNFVGLKVGTIDGLYENKSKYIAVEISESEGVAECVPCGFMGYPVPNYGTDGVLVAYNTILRTDIKTRRQYFGLNSDLLDEDLLTFKGVGNYSEATASFTKGFHMDSRIGLHTGVIRVDDVEHTFECVEASQGSAYETVPMVSIESEMQNSIYEDVTTRKFTVYPYGGFDGWDIYREVRSNTNEFKASKYKIGEKNCPFVKATDGGDTNPMIDLNLPVNAITSDYYAYLAAYRQFANPQEIDINVFATPGIDFFNHSLLVDDVIDMIEDSEDGRGGDALYLFTSPQVKMNGEEMTADDVVRELEDSDIDSSYAATYFPWVKFYDSEYKMYLDLPVTKDVVRNLAATDNTSFPWFAPAGMTRGNVECVRAYKKTTLAEEDTLYDGRINPVKTFGADGVKIWGNKTVYSKDTPLNRINVRRLMIRVKKLVVSTSKSLIFEQYDATLEKQFRSIVEPILSDVQSNRGIADYRVITENTAETRDQHILPAKILIKPINALEYISISFTVYPESVSFDE